MLPYIHSYRDRHGTLRYYFRRGNAPKLRLRGDPTSPEFHAAYQAALAGNHKKPVGVDRNSPESVARWVALYLSSAAFATLAPTTRSTRRNLLERFRQKNGEKPAASLTQERIEQWVGKMSPVVARNFLKTLRPWLAWCVKQGMRKDNPALAVERPRYRTEGYKPWGDEQVEHYRARHAIGTKARLAFELLANTGAARADVVRLGQQHVRDGILSFRRHKTKVPVEIPVLPELRAILDASRTGNMTFLLTEYGKPFTPDGFGQWFRERCNEAGVPPGYSAHGVRKYAARVRADLGATAHQLMAWFGWLTIREAERYTRDADRRRAAIELGRKIIDGTVIGSRPVPDLAPSRDSAG